VVLAGLREIVNKGAKGAVLGGLLLKALAALLFELAAALVLAVFSS
jgi:hypothetical protein